MLNAAGKCKELYLSCCARSGTQQHECYLSGGKVNGMAMVTHGRATFDAPVRTQQNVRPERQQIH